MTRDEINTLKAVCVDLKHAAEVGKSEGLLDEYEANKSNSLANEGIAILSRVRPRKSKTLAGGSL